MKLALFDIDGTLVRAPSTERRFARWLRERRHIGWRQYLAFAAFTLRYLPRYGSGVFRKNKAYLAGLTERQVGELAERFVMESLPQALFEPACEQARRHRRKGDEVWLLSGTLKPIAEALAGLLQLELEHTMASDCPASDGVMVGRPPERHPYGIDKLTFAREICECAGEGMENTVAYGDSWADHHLLRAVGTAVAVLPDEKLKGLAAERGWRVMSDTSESSTPGNSAA